MRPNVSRWCSVFLAAALAVSVLGCGGSSSDGTEKETKAVSSLAVSEDHEISESLTWIGRDTNEYARQFAIDRYEEDYVLLSLGDGSRYLVVPEGQEAPTDLEEDVTVLARPLDRIYLVATAVMDMFSSLDAVEDVRFSGTKAEGWYIEDARDAMEQGDMIYAGKYNAPDYEKIVSEGCDLAVENTMIGHSPEVKEKLEGFGIPVLTDHSSYENHPLGRMEWIKFYGVITGREEEAEEAFRAQTALLEDLDELDQSEGKTVAFFYITANGSVNVRRTSDYVPRMIDLAGGEYIFTDLGEDDSRSSTMNMQMEEFYNTAREADYLIYNSAIEGELSDVEDLLDKSKMLADFKAVKEGHVWCTTENLYQESMSLGTMISDIHGMLAGADPEEMTFLYPLE